MDIYFQKNIINSSTFDYNFVLFNVVSIKDL